MRSEVSLLSYDFRPNRPGTRLLVLCHLFVRMRTSSEPHTQTMQTSPNFAACYVLTWLCCYGVVVIRYVLPNLWMFCRNGLCRGMSLYGTLLRRRCSIIAQANAWCMICVRNWLQAHVVVQEVKVIWQKPHHRRKANHKEFSWDSLCCGDSHIPQDIEECRQRGQIVAKKFCAAVKIVAKQSTTGCHGVDSIAQSHCTNSPPSPGIASCSPSTVTPRHAVSRHPSVETPHRHRPLRGRPTSTVTPRRRAVPVKKHPAVTRRRAFPLQKHPAVTRHRAANITR